MTEQAHKQAHEQATKKVAVVTGASSGIGAASARALAADGWHVILGARRLERMQAIAQEIGGEAIALDVSDQGSVDAFAEQVQRCDLLVNNAGGAIGLDAVADANVEEWQRMYEINVLGTLRVSKALLPKLREANGHIINMSSVAGIAPYAGGAGYNAAKFGLSAMTKVMRIELAEQHLRISEINPGRVETDFSLVRFRGDQQQAEKVYADKLNLRAEDIAEAVRWIAACPAHMNIDRMVITPQDQVI
ncbi:SDR family oxidoreductase [Corynebacterium pseudopelargi]|uniref:Serine 3-dehydrogenase n=1 Tax=Corynebacterium pseudopelargi TaxID=2080757 RepID=A0A3G6IWB6_9CORY|nr:SDR family oxidoreductase [Corynebacterium pseudopelargi]AZA08254.1 Serine 3-dehydrogenase [Corynebacterium pseudopelargi]